MSEERFPFGSRYEGVPIATSEGPDGSRRLFLRRRFIPPPTAFALLAEHAVSEGERLDQIANQYLDDSEQYWRICDANGALDPDELMIVGRRIRITLPEGVPGARDVR